MKQNKAIGLGICSYFIGKKSQSCYFREPIGHMEKPAVTQTGEVGEGEMLAPPLWQESWSGVLRARKLALLFTGCSTQKSGPCTSPKLHSRADPGDKGTDEPASRLCV